MFLTPKEIVNAEIFKRETDPIMMAKAKTLISIIDRHMKNAEMQPFRNFKDIHESLKMN